VEGWLELVGLVGEEAQTEEGRVILGVGEEDFAVGFGGVEEMVLGVVVAGSCECCRGGVGERGGHADGLTVVAAGVVAMGNLMRE